MLFIYLYVCVLLRVLPFWRYNNNNNNINNPPISRSPRMSVMRVIVFYPCIKFAVHRIDLPVRKIRRIFRLSINRPFHRGHPIVDFRALPSWTYGQARDRQTDRQTTAINA